MNAHTAHDGKGSAAPAAARGGGSASHPPGAETRRRLLTAAERLFAEQGYANTSVRELTQAAQVNLASVNYHFGGKLNLYTELFRQTLVELRERRAAWIEAALARPDASLETLLRAFCEGFVDPLLEDGRGRRLMELYGREMQEPLLPANLFFDELINPMRRLMRRAFEQVCPSLPGERVEYCLLSLVGQLLHALHMAHHMERMGEGSAPAFEMTATIDHIVTFSAAGIRAVADQGAH